MSSVTDVTIPTVLGNISAAQSTFTWQIPNFNTIKSGKGECIWSPTFVTTLTTHQEFCQSSSNINLRWRIKLYPSGNHDEDYIAVYLENLDVALGMIEVTTTSSIALMDNFNTNKIATSSCFIERRTYEESKKTWGWSKFERKESIWQQCSITNTLTFFCHIYSTTVECHGPESDEEDRSKALMNHFEILFNSGQFSDMTISIGNQKLCVHKNIVSSLSPVFQAMFENKMKEQNESLVEIVDIEFDIMKEMFRYIYVGKVNGIDRIASDLLMAADKYLVKGLKGLCEKSLSKNLDMTNALKCLEIAIQYNTKRLKSKALQFVVENLESFNNEKELKEISSECKTELLSSIANNRSESFPIFFNHSISCDDIKSNVEVGLLDHFEMLFNTGNFNDMKIKVGDQELPIHTSIVTFLSPVFQAMFESRIKNHDENKVIEINDIEFDTLKEMLRYMYTRKVNGIEQIGGKLFMAADKYDVKGLKQFCENSLCNNLDMHNALERLEMSVQSKMNKVNQVVSQFIVQNLKVFIGKPEFKKLSSDGKNELLNVIAKVKGNARKSNES